ncbi:MAG: hypothetical protein H7841_01640 [Magnetospirillum sp. WYHS-4]
MRFRLRLIDLVLVLLIGIMAIRHWPYDPAKEAWRVGFRQMIAGDHETALARFDDVLTAQPGFQRAFFYRGYSLFFLGRFNEAAQDFSEGLSLGGDPYMLFWRYMARRRSGAEGDGELLAGLRERNLDLDGWPGILGATLMGTASEDAVLARAVGENADSQAGLLAEAHFYLGQRRLIEGERDKALAHFRKAVATGAINYLEQSAAAQEVLALSSQRPEESR